MSGDLTIPSDEIDLNALATLEDLDPSFAVMVYFVVYETNVNSTMLIKLQERFKQHGIAGVHLIHYKEMHEAITQICSLVKKPFTEVILVREKCFGTKWVTDSFKDIQMIEHGLEFEICPFSVFDLDQAFIDIVPQIIRDFRIYFRHYKDVPWSKFNTIPGLREAQEVMHSVRKSQMGPGLFGITRTEYIFLNSHLKRYREEKAQSIKKVRYINVSQDQTETTE